MVTTSGNLCESRAARPLGRWLSHLVLAAGLAGALVGVPGAARAEVPRVVTDIAPVHSLVARVMQGVGTPELLMDQGADAHHFALRPSQARALQSADLVVWIGPEMTPWLASALAGIGDGAGRLGLLAASGTLRLDYGQTGSGDHAHDHGDDHDHNHGNEHDHDHGHDHGHHDHDHDDHGHDHHGHDDGHGHSHDGTDPHAWLDPANAVAWLDLIAAELAGRDPDHAAEYRANAEAGRAELVALDARIAADLAAHAGKAFVVAHDAYGYFTGHYGLTSAGAVADGDAVAPGAARLRALRSELAAKGVVCAFPEVGRDAGLIALVLEGSTTRLGAPLDPEGRGLSLGAELYPALLAGLAANIAACLGGAE